MRTPAVSRSTPARPPVEARQRSFGLAGDTASDGAHRACVRVPATAAFVAGCPVMGRGIARQMKELPSFHWEA